MFEVVIKLDTTDKLLEAVRAISEAVRGVKAVSAETPAEPAKEAKPKRAAAKKTAAKKPVAKKADTTTVKETAKPVTDEAEQAESETEKVPTKEELRQATVLAIKKDRNAVLKMLEDSFPGCAKISDIPESDRERAMFLLNKIAEG